MPDVPEDQQPQFSPGLLASGDQAHADTQEDLAEHVTQTRALVARLGTTQAWTIGVLDLARIAAEEPETVAALLAAALIRIAELEDDRG